MENKMYPFIDTAINEKYIPEYIPTSAMFYDGVLLEGVIEGYQTLSVTGREMISVNIESEAVQVGSIITNQTLPSRTLTVQYKLSDKDPEVLQTKFDSLKRRLYRLQDVPIQFNDELDYTYYGRFASSQNPPGDTNSIVSSFEIFCADPRKYTKQFKTPGLISTYTPYQILPDNIRIVLNRPTSVAVSNGDKVMSITGAGIASGDVIDFKPKEGKVFVNGIDKTSILDLSSDFKNFFISKGDIVKTNNGKLEVSYRAVML